MNTLSANVNLSQIIAYENGELGYEEIIELFQSLVDSGLAWRLQGSYGRMAVRLIEDGLVTHPDAQVKR